MVNKVILQRNTKNDMMRAQKGGVAMRLRHIKGSEESVSESPFVVPDPQSLKGKWRGYFGNGGPLMIEIGMGKGKFITETAELNPNVDFIGIEKYSSVLLKAIRKRERLEHDPGNVEFICADASSIGDIFAPEEVDRIYLNFPDPWPKKRYADRRLTSGRFLKIYDAILKSGGTIEFKTDNAGLFDYSLESLHEAGWEVSDVTYDLAADGELSKGNIMTEYELKFAEEGKPICRLTASRGRRISP